MNIVFILQSHFYTNSRLDSEVYTKFEAPYATLERAKKAAGDEITPAQDWYPVGTRFWRTSLSQWRWWSIEEREVR